MLEILVVQLTIYLWVAFRFVDVLPERQRAADLRNQANDRIAALLTEKKSLPVLDRAFQAVAALLLWRRGQVVR